MKTDRLAIDGGERACARRPPLGKGIDALGDEEIAAVTEVLRARTLFRFGRHESRVAAFETAAADAFGCEYVLATSSGTAALKCSLIALGVQPGDEVIVPAVTFIATVNAVAGVGAVPVIAEVDDSLTIDPDDVAAKRTERTVAIVPVHLENVVADLDRIGGAPVLEDAAQAIGTTYHGRAAGTIGAIGACSLQQTKNITTGEGGLVLTDDEDLYVRAARFHDQGGQFVTQYRGGRGSDRGEPMVGDNLRMTEIAGAIGLVQLQRLPRLLAAMRENRDRIASAIGAVDGLTPRRVPDAAGAGGSSLTWFAPDAATAQRIVAALRGEGAPAAQMYDGRPVAQGVCPRSEELLGRSVTIGIGPAFTPDDCDGVAAAVHKVGRHLL